MGIYLEQVRKRLSFPLTMVGTMLGRALFGLALAYSVYYHARVEILPFDDAYITYRYVANFLAGRGLVYNVSERVFGSTTPLYVLWLILLKASFPAVALPTLAVRANALFHLLSAIALVGMSYHLLGRWLPALCLGSLLALSPEMLNVSAGGMETFLFIALAIGAFWALAYQRSRLAAILAGLSLLARPEGAFVVGIWGLSWLLRKGRRDWLAPLLVAWPLAGWVIFATPYYGTPVPHSLIAKSAPLYVLPRGEAAAYIMAQLSRWGWLQRPMAFAPRPGALVTFVILALSLHGLSVSPGARQRAGWAPPIMLVSVIALYALANTLVFQWYLPMIWVFWALVIVTGLPHFGVWIADRARWVSTLRRRMLVGILTFLGLVVVAHVQLGDFVVLWRAGRILNPSVATPDRMRVEAYRQAAMWLNDMASATATAAAPEIGAFGFYFRGHIYDACGLVSPQALPFLPVPADERLHGAVGAIGTAFVRATRPDYVVTLPYFSSKSIDRDAWFQANYSLIKRIPLPMEIAGSAEVLIYSRKPDKSVLTS